MTESDKKVYRIEGTEFVKINEMSKMVDEVKTDALDRIHAFLKKEAKSVEEMNQRLWKQIYEVLHIDPNGQYSLDTSTRDAGLLLVRERSRKEKREEEDDEVGRILRKLARSSALV